MAQVRTEQRKKLPEQSRNQPTKADDFVEARLCSAERRVQSLENQLLNMQLNQVQGQHSAAKKRRYMQVADSDDEQPKSRPDKQSDLNVPYNHSN